MIQAEVQTRTALPKTDPRYISAPAFAEFPGLRAVSTTRLFQQNLPENFTRTQEIQQACAMLELGSCAIFHGEQKHTSNVAIVDGTPRSEAPLTVLPQTDGLVSATPGSALVVQTADCAPIFLYDPKARVMGLAHAGWKGTLARIGQNAVAQMESLGAVADRIVSWIGPMAGKCCYEVSPELIEQFQTEFARYAPQQVHAGRHLDLVEINRLQLLEAGLRAEHISNSGVCTIHQKDQFFSYRGDNGTTGRILSIIAMPST